MKLSIIIPAYNEEKTILQLLSKVEQVKVTNVEFEIIIINDCSKDGTWEILQQKKSDKRYKLLSNAQNLGKSRTVQRGILESTGDYVIIQDADLEYDPQDWLAMLPIVMDGKADVVYGNRFGKDNKVVYWLNYIGNRGLSVISNFFTFPRIRTWIPDLEVCYKLIPGNVARQLAAKLTATSNFGFEPEITARLVRYKHNGKRLRFATVPVSYYPRTVAEGKKMKAVHDGAKALIEIIKYNIG